MTAGCVFCDGPGGQVLYEDPKARVVLADEPFAGFCRVVWRMHVREMTDLAERDRAHVMRLVFATEAGLRAMLGPVKVNLASLGNLVPHVHWHVIPRFPDDSHFPQPVWGTRQRDPAPRALPPGFAAALGARIAQAAPKEGATS